MTALEFYEQEKNNIKVEKSDDGAITFKRLMIKFAEMYHKQAITVTQCCKSDSEQLPNMTLEQAIAKAKPNLDKITDVDKHIEDIR